MRILKTIGVLALGSALGVGATATAAGTATVSSRLSSHGT